MSLTLGSFAVASPVEVAPAPPRLSAALVADTVRRAAELGTLEGLRPLVELAVGSGFWDAGSVLAVEPGRTLRTVTHVGDRAVACDGLQLELGEGPSLNILRSGGPMHTIELLSERRWPRWSPAVLAIGVRTVLSVRLFTAQAVGALNLYGISSCQRSSAAVADAELVAAHTSVLLASIVTRNHLEKGLQARTLIGQAQGILMQRFGLPPSAAFALLRRLSQHHNVKIAVLADRLVSTGHLPGLDNAPIRGNAKTSTADPVESEQSHPGQQR